MKVVLKNDISLPLFNFMITAWAIIVILILFKILPVGDLIQSGNIAASIFLLFFTVLFLAYGFWFIAKSAATIDIDINRVIIIRNYFGIKKKHKVPISNIISVNIKGNLAIGHVVTIFDNKNCFFDVIAGGLVVVEGNLDDMPLNKYSPLNPGQRLAHQLAGKISKLSRSEFKSEFIC